MTDTNTKSGKSGRIMKRQREVDDDDDNVAVTPGPQSANKSKHITNHKYSPPLHIKILKINLKN